MELGLKGKKALVTGASYGLGYACADALAGEGVDVVICSRDKEKISSAAKSISSHHRVKAFGVTADLTRQEDLERLAQESHKELGHVDILVVSTGHPPTMPFSKATDKDWEFGESLVLRPPLVLSKLFIDGMRQRKFGRIIMIGSIFGLEPEQSSVVQSTFRTGLNALAKCIATEAAPDGVTVNVVCPGYFDTPLVRDLAKQYAQNQKTTVENILESWKDYSPVKRFGKPEDLGALVAFLASPRAEFMTGTAVTIDGGAIRQY